MMDLNMQRRHWPRQWILQPPERMRRFSSPLCAIWFLPWAISIRYPLRKESWPQSSRKTWRHSARATSRKLLPSCLKESDMKNFTKWVLRDRSFWIWQKNTASTSSSWEAGDLDRSRASSWAPYPATSSAEPVVHTIGSFFGRKSDQFAVIRISEITFESGITEITGISGNSGRWPPNLQGGHFIFLCTIHSSHIWGNRKACCRAPPFQAWKGGARHIWD